jgi:hypothetical protein
MNATKRKGGAVPPEDVVLKKRTKTVNQRYKKDYCLKFPMLTASRVSESHAFCTFCKLDFSVAHGGANDCKKHCQTEAHKLRANAASKCQSKISGFVSKDADLPIINAEVMFTNFIIEHNLPISVADHAGPLFRRMFSDSECAKRYGCARTKTTAIIQMLGKDDESRITEILKKQAFSLATDGSTDLDDAKLYPIVVRYFDRTLEKIVCSLLTLVESKVASTGANIYKLLDDELQKRKIPWANCLSFSSDNAAVMSGLGKGVAGIMDRTHPGIYFVGCACHLMHLAAQKAALELPCAVVDTLIDIYYYLDKSSNRKQNLQDFQTLHGKDTRKILKLVNTRWLSLQQCLERLLDMWEPLQEYFSIELEKQTSNVKCSK